jgi:integrase
MNDKTTWNKGRIVGRKAPLTPEQVQVIKTLLSQAGNVRDIALFSLAIDSSLRGCDLVALHVSDVQDGAGIRERVTIAQRKTGERVTFAMTDYTREALRELVERDGKGARDALFTSERKGKGKPLTPAHYRRLVKGWLALARLDVSRYGSHSLRRTKIALIYKKTGNLKTAQVLLGHKSIQHTQNYLGIEENEALEIAKQFDGYFR